MVTLNDLKRRDGRYFDLFQRLPCFEANYVNMIKNGLRRCATKMQLKESSFWQHMIWFIVIFLEIT